MAEVENLAAPVAGAAGTDATSAPPAGTVTFLFTDIEGSAKRWEYHPAAMRAALARHDALLHEGISAHGGVVLTERGEGDSFFALFARSSDALAAACALQRALVSEAWPATVAPIRVRMALHSGEAGMRDGADYRGAAVNRCARLRAVAHGGQVLLSGATYELVRDALPPEVDLRDLGQHRLKDLTRPERIFQVLIPGLPPDFPPLKTLDQQRHNLPVQPTALIGREREVREVRERLLEPDTHLLTLTGVGGTGKTRLALQVAAEVLDAFPDGAYFVNLAPITDPTLAVPTIARTLGLTEAGSQPLRETLHAHLHEKRLLLLLDNVEHLVDTALVVADLLAAATQVRVLVTSRAALHLRGERLYVVPPLTLPALTPLPPLERLTQYEAVRLFIARARDVKPDFAISNETAPAVADICVRLDGLPLSIELAAAPVRLFTPQALLARLGHRLGVLTGGARDLPERQRTLRATIDWSYGLLTAEEQSLFARLSVFVGGRTLEAIEAICNPDGALEALGAVESLLEKNLLMQTEVQGEPRFVMLETLHEYARERLEASGEAELLRQAHAAYFLALAEEAAPLLAGPAQAVWRERLEREHANLRAALAWALERGEIATALRLGGALLQFWRVAHLAEGRRWLDAALARSDGAEPSLRAQALQGAGWFAIMQSDLDRAVAQLEQSLVLHRAAGDTHATATVLWRLATVALLRQDREQAEALLAESLRLYQDLGDEVGVTMCRHCQGQVAYYAEGHLDRARVLYEQSLEQFRRLGSRSIRGAASCLGDLVIVAVDQGDYARPRALLPEALALSGRVGMKDLIAGLLEEAAIVAGAGGHPVGAARLWGVAEALRDVIGAPHLGIDGPRYECRVAEARARLDAATFESAWAGGRALSPEQAIAEALQGIQ